MKRNLLPALLATAGLLLSTAAAAQSFFRINTGGLNVLIRQPCLTI